MKTGVFAGIAAHDYHNGHGLSRSALTALERSPLHFWQQHLNPDREPKPETDALVIGTAIHTAVLEPDQFAVRYVTVPHDAPREPTSTQRNAKKPSDDTLLAIHWWNEFTAKHAGKVILSDDDYDRCLDIAEAVLSHPVAASVLKTGDAEQSVYWIDEETGVLCRCRPDWLDATHRRLVDVKSTTDARPEAFAASILKYGYDIQAAWYLDGVRAATGQQYDEFVFVAVEKDAPFATAVYVADEYMIAEGRRKYRELLNLYADCASRNDWPGYPETLQTIGLPDWYVRKMEFAAANDNEEMEIAYVE